MLLVYDILCINRMSSSTGLDNHTIFEECSQGSRILGRSSLFVGLPTRVEIVSPPLSPMSTQRTLALTPTDIFHERPTRKRETPRPVAHKACEDGFKAGFTATKELITKKIESVS